MAHLSRREFAAMAASAAAAPFVLTERSPGAASITAQDVIDRIKKNIGVEWKSETVDVVKAGDPSAIVTGIVTTSMATMSVLQQAVKAGANIVITGQPTFYSRADAKNPPAGRGGGPAADIAGSRFHGQERVHRQDTISSSSASATTGACADPIRSRRASRPHSGGRSISLPAILSCSRCLRSRSTRLVEHVKRGLKARGGIRVVGDPHTTRAASRPAPRFDTSSGDVEAAPDG